MITETDQLVEALNEAAKLWPEHAGQRAVLLRKVLEIGIETIQAQSQQKKTDRLARVEKLAGSMDGVWPADWREELSEDWPK